MVAGWMGLLVQEVQGSWVRARWCAMQHESRASNKPRGSVFRLRHFVVFTSLCAWANHSGLDNGSSQEQSR